MTKKIEKKEYRLTGPRFYAIIEGEKKCYSKGDLVPLTETQVVAFKDQFEPKDAKEKALAKTKEAKAKTDKDKAEADKANDRRKQDIEDKKKAEADKAAAEKAEADKAAGNPSNPNPNHPNQSGCAN